MKTPIDMQVGSIHTTNNDGDISIDKYNSWDSVSCIFVSTGYIAKATANQIRIGSVKDRLAKTVRGVGFIGVGDYKSTLNGKPTKQSGAWRSMLQRCYDPKYQENQPTYIGCTVCEEWYDFQVFAKWFDGHYIEGFHLDKDITQRGVDCKIYSPETCAFISMEENAVEATAKTYILTNPVGAIVEIYNLSLFCKDNNLDWTYMSLVARGKKESYRGWTKAPI